MLVDFIRNTRNGDWLSTYTMSNILRINISWGDIGQIMNSNSFITNDCEDITDIHHLIYRKVNKGT